MLKIMMECDEYGLLQFQKRNSRSMKGITLITLIESLITLVIDLLFEAVLKSKLSNSWHISEVIFNRKWMKFLCTLKMCSLL